MPKIIRKLSEAQVRNALPLEKPYKLYDEGGLRLLVRPTGAKVWQYPYILNGKLSLFSFIKELKGALLQVFYPEFWRSAPGSSDGVHSR